MNYILAFVYTELRAEYIQIIIYSLRGDNKIVKITGLFSVRTICNTISLVKIKCMKLLEDIIFTNKKYLKFWKNTPKHRPALPYHTLFNGTPKPITMIKG